MPFDTEIGVIIGDVGIPVKVVVLLTVPPELHTYDVDT